MADDLDRLLAAALAEYRDAEPSADLPQRILARRPARISWKPLATAAGVAAALLAGLYLWRPAAPPPAIPVVAETSLVVPVSLPSPRLVLRRVRPAVRQKLQQFPAPSGPTSEERLLVAYARSGREAPAADLRPIEIAPLEIPPILNEEGNP